MGGHTDIVRDRRSVDARHDFTASHDSTAVHQVASHGNREPLSVLIEAGADPRAQDTAWSSPGTIGQPTTG